MSRSGYSEDLSPQEMNTYRGQVASATRGKRGQALVRDLLDALEAMPEKRLHANVFDDGEHMCALGAVARLRGVKTDDIDPEEYCAWDIAERLDVAHQLAAEVMFLNDEMYYGIDSRTRWSKTYAWALRHVRGERSPVATAPTSVTFEGATHEGGRAAEYPFNLRRRDIPMECRSPSPCQSSETGSEGLL